MDERGSLLVVELVKVLHVPEDDVLLVDDPWRNLLHSAGHFPQVGLHSGNETPSANRHKAKHQRVRRCGTQVDQRGTVKLRLTSMHSLRSRT